MLCDVLGIVHKVTKEYATPPAMLKQEAHNRITYMDCDVAPISYLKTATISKITFNSAIHMMKSMSSQNLR